MVQINRYENGIIYSCCSKCGINEYAMDINTLLTDDCVVHVIVKCPVCNNGRDLYILMCKTESKAKELSAALELLKIGRG